MSSKKVLFWLQRTNNLPFEILKNQTTVSLGPPPSPPPAPREILARAGIEVLPEINFKTYPNTWNKWAQIVPFSGPCTLSAFSCFYRYIYRPNLISPFKKRHLRIRSSQWHYLQSIKTKCSKKSRKIRRNILKQCVLEDLSLTIPPDVVPKNKQNLHCSNVADPGSGAFWTHGSGIQNRFFPDPWSQISDPGSQTHIFEDLVTMF